jgi:hypothetical protein
LPELKRTLQKETSMSQPEHQIITTRRIISYGPNALQFFLLQGQEGGIGTIQVNGAYSDCTCGKCTRCTTAYSAELELAGVIDVSMEKRRFIFMGTVAGAEKLTSPRIGPEKVLGCYEPRGKNGLRGWIEPMTLRPRELAFHLLSINQTQSSNKMPLIPAAEWIYHSSLSGVVERVHEHRPGKILLPDGRQIMGKASFAGDAVDVHLDFGQDGPSKKALIEHVGRLVLENPEPFTVTSNKRSVTWMAVSH